MALCLTLDVQLNRGGFGAVVLLALRYVNVNVVTYYYRGACCFQSWYLTTSLPGQVHLVNVTNVVFVHTPCSHRLFCARTGLVSR